MSLWAAIIEEVSGGGSITVYESYDEAKQHNRMVMMGGNYLNESWVEQLEIGREYTF